MKNIFFGLLILSSSLIYSAGIKINIQNEKDMNFDTESFRNEIDSLDDIITVNGKGHLNEWKVLKGLAGLIIGTKCFFAGGTGIIFSLIFSDKLWSDMVQPSIISSPVEKLFTNRLLWLSLSSALTIFSLWLLKKSIANIYYGFNGNRKEY